MRSRFIVGYDPANADYNAEGKTGGLKEVTLTENQMPSHTHSGNTNSAGSHRHTTQIREDESGANTGNGPALMHTDQNDEQLKNYYSDYQGAHSHSLTIDSKGGGEAHENRPPYYTAVFIQFKGV